LFGFEDRKWRSRPTLTLTQAKLFEMPFGRFEGHKLGDMARSLRGFAYVVRLARERPRTPVGEAAHRLLRGLFAAERGMRS
jgi:hypothetical protein